MGQRWINNDVYIYERKFFGNVAWSRSIRMTTNYSISGLNTSLPAGSYSDYLTGYWVDSRSRSARIGWQ